MDEFNDDHDKLICEVDREINLMITLRAELDSAITAYQSAEEAHESSEGERKHIEALVDKILNEINK